MTSNADSDALNLAVRTLEHGTIRTTVPANGTLADLKRQLQHQTQLPSTRQRILHRGRELQDNTATLASFDVGDNAVLHMVAGNAPQAPSSRPTRPANAPARPTAGNRPRGAGPSGPTVEVIPGPEIHIEAGPGGGFPPGMMGGLQAAISASLQAAGLGGNGPGDENSRFGRGGAAFPAAGVPMFDASQLESMMQQMGQQFAGGTVMFGGPGFPPGFPGSGAGAGAGGRGRQEGVIVPPMPLPTDANGVLTSSLVLSGLDAMLLRLEHENMEEDARNTSQPSATLSTMRTSPEHRAWAQAAQTFLREARPVLQGADLNREVLAAVNRVLEGANLPPIALGARSFPVDSLSSSESGFDDGFSTGEGHGSEEEDSGPPSLKSESESSDGESEHEEEAVPSPLVDAGHGEEDEQTDEGVGEFFESDEQSNTEHDYEYDYNEEEEEEEEDFDFWHHNGNGSEGDLPDLVSEDDDPSDGDRHTDAAMGGGRSRRSPLPRGARPSSTATDARRNIDQAVAWLNSVNQDDLLLVTVVTAGALLKRFMTVMGATTAPTGINAFALRIAERLQSLSTLQDVNRTELAQQLRLVAGHFTRVAATSAELGRFMRHLPAALQSGNMAFVGIQPGFIRIEENSASPSGAHRRASPNVFFPSLMAVGMSVTTGPHHGPPFTVGGVPSHQESTRNQQRPQQQQQQRPLRSNVGSSASHQAGRGPTQAPTPRRVPPAPTSNTDPQGSRTATPQSSTDAQTLPGAEQTRSTFAAAPAGASSASSTTTTTTQTPPNFLEAFSTVRSAIQRLATTSLDVDAIATDITRAVAESASVGDQQDRGGGSAALSEAVQTVLRRRLREAMSSEDAAQLLGVLRSVVGVDLASLLSSQARQSDRERQSAATPRAAIPRQERTNDVLAGGTSVQSQQQTTHATTAGSTPVTSASAQQQGPSGSQQQGGTTTAAALPSLGRGPAGLGLGRGGLRPRPQQSQPLPSPSAPPIGAAGLGAATLRSAHPAPPTRPSEQPSGGAPSRAPSQSVPRGTSVLGAALESLTAGGGPASGGGAGGAGLSSLLNAAGPLLGQLMSGPGAATAATGIGGRGGSVTSASAPQSARDVTREAVLSAAPQLSEEDRKRWLSILERDAASMSTMGGSSGQNFSDAYLASMPPRTAGGLLGGLLGGDE